MNRSPIDIANFILIVFGILTGAASVILTSLPLFLLAGVAVGLGLAYFAACESSAE